MARFANQKIEPFEKCEISTSIFLKVCLFLKTEMGSLPPSFAGNTMKCISIDGYPETSTCMLYAAVNATRSPQKAIDWNDTLSSKPSKEIKLSWHQSIYKKHF
jgi:hypothetical protein